MALIFIMFYGGFGTSWPQARPVAGKAVLLSSLGTVLTAGLVGLFCWRILALPALESFLLGAVISSTDAASVFSILRSKRLDLRDNTASLLEVESGSNDPFSYMLTIILLSLMTGEPPPLLCLPGLCPDRLRRRLWGGYRPGDPVLSSSVPVCL